MYLKTIMHYKYNISYKQPITKDTSNRVSEKSGSSYSGIDTPSATSFMENTVTGQIECRFYFI